MADVLITAGFPIRLTERNKLKYIEIEKAGSWKRNLPFLVIFRISFF